MDTQPRAEDEVLPQHETQSEEHVAPEESDAASGVLMAADEADGADEPIAEATDDLELLAEELLDEAVGTEPEAPLEDLPETAAAEGQERVAEETADEPASVEVSAEERTVETVERIQVEVPAMAPSDVSEAEFTQMVDDALEAVGGILLFKMRLDEDGDDKHVAAASIGDGARRQFLLLSLPVSGGKLKVESASRSTSPLAKLAVAYVGVVEAFNAAA